METNDDIYRYFNKKFKFFKKPNWHLPHADVCYSSEQYKYEPLFQLKHELNTVKSKLNDYQIEEWSQHTRRRNLAGDIIWKIKNEIQCEFVTQAWAKFFEIINSYNFVNLELCNKDKKTFNSVHLCEAPGAFISSLNHYLKINHSKLKFQWHATTLNPYYEGNPLSNMIIDDRFIFHTLNNWSFGDDFTGNIMNMDNVNHLKEKCFSNMKKIDLVTADGSIDCLNSPENQEAIVSKLHYAEVVTALKLLAKGGNFIIKMFTFFEDFSINLLYLLNCCFDNVHVFKPITSKEGNSEVYVIALNYLQLDDIDTYLKKIFDNLDNEKYSLFPLENLPESFLQQIVICSQYFMRLQIEVIENNIRFFEFFNKRENYRIRMLRNTIQLEYFRLYNLQPITDANRIISADNPKIAYNFNNLNPRAHSGSYTERKFVEKSLGKNDKIQILCNKLYTFYQSTNMYDDNKLLEFKIDDDNASDCDRFNVTLAKPIEKIESSKFVLVSVLKLLLSIIDCTAEVNTAPNNFILESDNHAELIINIYSFRDLNNNYNDYEKDIILRIIDFISACWSSTNNGRNQILVIENLLLLTQFSIGFMYFLKQNIFNSIKFSKNGVIFLQNFKSAAIDSDLQMLKQIIVESRAAQQTKSIIGLFDIKCLFKIDFYSAIIDYNNFVCLKYCSQYLNSSMQ